MIVALKDQKSDTRTITTRSVVFLSSIASESFVSSFASSTGLVACKAIAGRRTMSNRSFMFGTAKCPPSLSSLSID